jgi:hypothetical protein
MAGNIGMRVSKYKYNFPCIGFLACTADAFKTFDGK